MMQKTNFCRSLLKQMKGFDYRAFPHGKKFIEAIELSQKFIIPANGVILNNCGTSIDVTQMNLPYRHIVLEFFDDDGGKNIVSAYQLKNSGSIYACAAYKSANAGEWGFSPVYIEINHEGVVPYPCNGIDKYEHESMFDFVGIILLPIIEFVEALSCKNVSPKSIRQQKSHKSKLDALPFDEYKILTVEVKHHKDELDSRTSIGNSHRSPREHLRRGHIRRLPSGNVWVQSCVVGAGNGGVISKTYALAA